MTYEYRGARRRVRRVVKESFAKGKAVTRLEIESIDHRVVDAGDADATSRLAATTPERAVSGQRMEAGDNVQSISAATVDLGCFWRTVALLLEAAAVGGACGNALGAVILTGGASACAFALGGAHLLAAMEDWQEDCAPHPA